MEKLRDALNRGVKEPMMVQLSELQARQMLESAEVVLAVAFATTIQADGDHRIANQLLGHSLTLALSVVARGLGATSDNAALALKTRMDQLTPDRAAGMLSEAAENGSKMHVLVQKIMAHLRDPDGATA